MRQSDSLENINLDAMLKTKMPALGIDLGGTKLSAAVVSDAQLVGEPKQISTPKTPEQIVDAIVGMIQAYQKHTVLAGVGIATAGVVERNTGKVIGATGNLPGWSGTPLKKIIENRIMLPVEVENDAKAAAYGEGKAGNLLNSKCVIVVTLGTGIGVGILIDGKVFHGAHGGAGHSGHIRISLENKRRCTCGLFDCWEAFGSGSGLEMTARELTVGISKEQSSMAHDPSKLTTHQIVTAAKAGDIIAQNALNVWHHHVAVGLISLLHTFNPDSFVLSGGLSEILDYQLLKELVLDNSISCLSKGIEIYPSRLCKNAGIIGAAEILLDTIMQRAYEKQ